MSREWKPGDVALVDSWRGKGLLAFRVKRGGLMGWCVLDGTDSRGLDDHEVTSARPALVIDPEDREQVERFAFAVERVSGEALQSGTTRYFQAALRSLLAPPKPEEPLGFAAVVEDAAGARWVRTVTYAAAPWYSPGQSGVDATTPRLASWADIDAVRELSRGVEGGR